jgi:di/tricarboxylate transporter
MRLTADQWLVFATLAAALVLFVTGWLRYDVVALCALLVLGLTGVIRPRAVFAGFADSAVISVAAVLVMSRGLRESGVIEVLAEWIAALGARFGDSFRIALLGFVVSFLSGFINDVGTLALFMPVATKLARKQKSPPGRLLMPLAYATLLGGMTTLVGAPVNLVISGYRASVERTGFGMFSFTPVGVGIALVGLAFVSIIGWRLLPERGAAGEQDELFKIDNYLTEARVPENSKAAGQIIRDLEAAADGGVTVISLLREGWREVAPSGFQVLHPGDVLLLSGDPESLETALAKSGLEIEAQKQQEEKQQTELKDKEKKESAENAQMVEAVVVPGAWLVGRTAFGMRLRDRYAINILAVSRRGGAIRTRLRDIRFAAGDVLLMQGGADALQQAFADLGLLPLAEREMRLGHPRRAVLALAVFAASLAAAALNLFSVAASLTSGAVAMMILGLLPLDAAYASLEGPVLVLIAAMISVAGALQSSGGSDVIARPLLALAHHLPAAGAVAMIYVVTMLVSNVTNYVATAVLMAPIAQSVAAGLGLALDPFLMAVAYGSVSAFLTPIGHPSNTLVMGPGGYRFADYARMGLPLSVLTTMVASLLIPHFWPLQRLAAR